MAGVMCTVRFPANLAELLDATRVSGGRLLELMLTQQELPSRQVLRRIRIPGPFDVKRSFRLSTGTARALLTLGGRGFDRSDLIRALLAYTFLSEESPRPRPPGRSMPQRAPDPQASRNLPSRSASPPKLASGQSALLPPQRVDRGVCPLCKPGQPGIARYCQAHDPTWGCRTCEVMPNGDVRRCIVHDLPARWRQ